MNIESMVFERFGHRNHVHLPSVGSFSGVLVPMPDGAVVWSLYAGGIHEAPVALSALYVPVPPRHRNTTLIDDMISDVYDHRVVKAYLKNCGLRDTFETVPLKMWPEPLAAKWDLSGEGLIMADGWIPVMVAEEPRLRAMKPFSKQFVVLVSGGQHV